MPNGHFSSDELSSSSPAKAVRNVVMEISGKSVATSLASVMELRLQDNQVKYIIIRAHDYCFCLLLGSGEMYMVMNTSDSTCV